MAVELLGSGAVMHWQVRFQCVGFYISTGLPARARACVYMCVCVCEREREREVNLHICVYTCWLRFSQYGSLIC